MTHLALRLTTRSEVRSKEEERIINISTRSLRLTARSNNEVRSEESSALCFTSNNWVRSITHLALRLTTRSEARNHIYSPFQGRSFRTIPSLSRKCSNFTRDRGLAITSATCSSVLMYWSFKAPLCTMSRMK
jgi:hypothetical protein